VGKTHTHTHTHTGTWTGTGTIREIGELLEKR
jgi:hypothetical protein